MDQPIRLPFDEFLSWRGDRSLVRAFEALWCCGVPEALARPTVAIVGTRSATPYGLRIARAFGSQLGKAGCCIISGLALGIDGAAHEGALAAGAPTIGVLGGGHRCFYPARNRPLALKMISAGGAVLSPFEPDRPAIPGQFLHRNAIVAALADAVVVIEAPARSGALNTAGHAAGRIPVFAVPGDVDRAHVAGCHALLRDGAILARSPQDVLDDLPGLAASAAPSTGDTLPLPLFEPLQQRIVDTLAQGESSLEDLMEACAAAPSALLCALTMLEVQGRVEPVGGARYGLAASSRR
jgi:DNA processing protein